MEEEDEKTEISLKYQIFNNYISLFTEVELSYKITEEIKLIFIGDKKKNILEIFNMGNCWYKSEYGKGCMENNMNMMNMEMNNMNMMNMGMNFRVMMVAKITGIDNMDLLIYPMMHKIIILEKKL